MALSRRRTNSFSRPLFPVGGLLALTLVASVQAREGLRGFGYWQSGVRDCSLNLAGQPQAPCQTLQVEQQMEGLLSLRFGAKSAVSRDASDQLIFVGTLRPGSAVPSCSMGRCRLPDQLDLSITTVSERNFDGRGLAQGLPAAWPAEGRCQLQDGRLSCEARSNHGRESWRAAADL